MSSHHPSGDQGAISPTPQQEAAAAISARINALYLMSPPIRRAGLPPTPQLQPPAPAWLYSALLGNGRLLVCLDETATPVQWFYPYVDSGPHLRSLLHAVHVKQDGEERLHWLAEEGWRHELRYLEGSAVVSASAEHAELGLRLERRLAVHPERDLLAVELRVTNLGSRAVSCRLITYAGIDIDLRPGGNCAYYDPEREQLTFFWSDRYIALRSDAPVSGFTCQQTSSGATDRVFEMAAAQQYDGQEFAVGRVSGALRHELGLLAAGSSATHSLLFACGRSLDEVRRLLSEGQSATAIIDETLAWWRERYAALPVRMATAEAQQLYQRSLIVLRLLSDRQSGGIIAAPEMDPTFQSSGGYGMCWLRDSSYNAYALDLAGRHAEARAFFDWGLRTQEANGCWYQRYYVSGQLAPTWGLVQFDEIGTFVWALVQHVRLTGDRDYGRQALPQLVRASEYMERELDAETGLAPITKDLWEEFDGISTYACAATWGAFQALAQLTALLNLESEARRWSEAAVRLKAAIERHLWDAARGRFLRGLKLKTAPLEEGQPFQSDEHTQEIRIAGRRWLARRADPTIDISLLGLSVPFGVFSPEDPRMRATAAAIAEQLASPVGGIYRYQGDSYRGGNPWIICALWLAWYDLLAGRLDEAEQLYRWALEHRTSLDLLPEQVSRLDGAPCWVVPLGWSHAMFVLVSHALQESGESHRSSAQRHS
jgi:glucoamylase